MRTRTLPFIFVPVALAALLTGAARAPKQPGWKSLPQARPYGKQENTGAYVTPDAASIPWKAPKFVYNEQAATGRKVAKVVVVIYDPVLEAEGGKRLTEHLKAADPVEYSHILANVVREASWGYINYEIVDVIRVDGYPRKVDGFRYTDDSYMQVRKSQKWQPATTSYRAVFEENRLIERCRQEGITEVWLWGATGFHIDEFAGYIPNRYARFPPTDNPWFYRPYDIPEELGRTTWVMGFNYEVGADNMIHSYTHRMESMAALGPGRGIWNTKTRRDPWNVFSRLEMDFPGTPSQVGNAHVPPNGQSGYDYNNKRRTLSNSDAWSRYPDLRGTPRLVSSTEWGNNQFGYQKWILEQVPKFPGATEHGYNNWWLYVANTDEDLLEYRIPDPKTYRLPSDLAAGAPRP